MSGIFSIYNCKVIIVIKIFKNKLGGNVVYILLANKKSLNSLDFLNTASEGIGGPNISTSLDLVTATLKLRLTILIKQT